jgi:hypothetical protein
MSNVASTQLLSFLRTSTEYVRNLHTSLTHLTSQNSILKAMQETSRMKNKGGDAKGKKYQKDDKAESSKMKKEG